MEQLRESVQISERLTIVMNRITDKLTSIHEKMRELALVHESGCPGAQEFLAACENPHTAARATPSDLRAVNQTIGHIHQLIRDVDADFRWLSYHVAELQQMESNSAVLQAAVSRMASAMEETERQMAADWSVVRPHAEEVARGLTRTTLRGIGLPME